MAGILERSVYALISIATISLLCAILKLDSTADHVNVAQSSLLQCRHTVENVLAKFSTNSAHALNMSNHDAAQKSMMAVYHEWWNRQGTLEDYSNVVLQRAYTQNLLMGRIVNDLYYLEIATSGGSAAYSSLLRNGTQPLNVVALGSGPGSELWSLMIFLGPRQLSKRLKRAVLVDAAPWGETVRELDGLFRQQLSKYENGKCDLFAAGDGQENEGASESPSSSFRVNFHQADVSSVFQANGQASALLASFLDRSPSTLNLVFLYRLTWDLWAHAAQSTLFSSFLKQLEDIPTVEVFVADAYSTSAVYQAGDGWQKQTHIEEGRTRDHRNFYSFRRAGS